MKREQTNMNIHKYLFDILFLIRGHMNDVTPNVKTELPLLQIQVLRILAESGPIPQSHLVTLMARDKSQITRLVQELDNKHMITKTANPKDGRSYIIGVKAHVREQVSIFKRHEAAITTDMTKGFSQKDRQVLENLLSQMYQNLKDRE